MDTENDPILDILKPLPEYRWTAVHTRARCEKVIYNYCRNKGIRCYLPLRLHRQRYQRRIVETRIPMFPGYLFVQIRAEDRNVVYQSHRAAAVLMVSEVQQARLIEDLRNVRLLERTAREKEVTVKPEIVPGLPVRITHGPMAGIEGIVERRKGLARVTINVEMLGQSVSVELDVAELKPE